MFLCLTNEYCSNGKNSNSPATVQLAQATALRIQDN